MEKIYPKFETVLWQGKVDEITCRICEDTSVEHLYAKGTDSEQWCSVNVPCVEAKAYKQAWLELRASQQTTRVPCLLDELLGLHPQQDAVTRGRWPVQHDVSSVTDEG